MDDACDLPDGDDWEEYPEYDAVSEAADLAELHAEWDAMYAHQAWQAEQDPITFDLPF